MTQADKNAVLERLIDRALLDQQIVNPAMLDPSPEELAAKIKEIRSGMPGAASRRTLEGHSRQLRAGAAGRGRATDIAIPHHSLH